MPESLRSGQGDVEEKTGIPVVDAAERIHREIYIDERTQLPNYKAFARDLKGRLKEAERGEIKSLALIMIDIDDFRDFNKRYGHQFGNQVLWEIAQVLKNNAFENAAPYRYGGEEMMVILKDSESEKVREIAEKIRQKVEERKIEHPEGPVGTTLSLGVSFYQKGEDYSQLIERADLALQEAKKLGKNRVEVAE